MAKEAKVINFGLTEEVMSYLEEMTKKYGEKGETKEMDESKKESNELKIMAISIIKQEVQKISEQLNDKKLVIGSDEWSELIKSLNAAMDVVRYY